MDVCYVLYIKWIVQQSIKCENRINIQFDKSIRKAYKSIIVDNLVLNYHTKQINLYFVILIYIDS